MSQTTVLITGIAGLLGARLADHLIDTTQCTVVGIDNLSGGYLHHVNPKAIFYQQDIADGIGTIFNKHKPDYVYHFAAYAAEGLSPFIRKFNYQNNVVVTAEVINQCITHQVKRLVFTSSMAVYGAGQTPFEESMTPQPIDPYGVAKFACEMDIAISGEQHGLDWCIIRPHNVYGAKQNIWDKYRNVLGIWMHQYLSGQNTLTIYGDGEQQRAFSCIDDCLQPLWQAATTVKASKQIINLGGTTPYCINEAADLLIQIMGGGRKQHLPERHEAKHAFSTHQKSVDLLNYKDNTNLTDGLTAMWQWAKLQKQQKIKQQPYEITQGLYDFWKSEQTKVTT
jgi:UDP-glucose 4-epimerase